jgi:hypothetical protein
MESPFSTIRNKTIALYLEPVLNNQLKTYEDVLTVSDIPDGPMSTLIQRSQFPKLSPFHDNTPSSRSLFTNSCKYLLTRYGKNAGRNSDNFMYLEDLPSVYGYFDVNGYKVLDNLTTMTFHGPVSLATTSLNSFSGHRRLICYFRYVSSS